MAEGVLFNVAGSLIEMLGSLRIKELRHTNYSASKTTSKRVICEGKHNLQFLELYWKFVDEDKVEYYEFSLEDLQPPSSVKKLSVWHFMGVRFGGWDSSLNSLVKLTLLQCNNCQYLPKLDQLRSLEELMVSGVEAEYMCSSADDNDFDANLFFPSLVTLQIEYCSNLKWWWWKKEVDGNNIRSFPRLSNLVIRDCPNLTSMPLFPTIEKVKLLASSSMALEETFKMMRGSKAHNTHPNISLLNSIDIINSQDLTSVLEGIDNLPSLKSMSMYNCPNLTSLLEGIDNLPSLEYISIIRCPNLTSSLLEGIDNLPSLEYISIINCPNLTSLLEGIDNLPSLQSINIINCPNLTSIPDYFRKHNACINLELFEDYNSVMELSDTLEINKHKAERE
ncbi:hypothetical protein G4B88_020376 [Cannabis sativa]|uniref:R13L1/DRL21-like LRR repeat region domain-containing protein n=1 Tax=Cannabis sativa TaxID=3483 RepID=A0A7J6END2_CANSA|nr:hypothetical protein G4B88_020376 [Cannabis sativa]